MPKRFSRASSQTQQHVWEPQRGRNAAGRRGILVCRRCANAFFKKRWHKGLSVLPERVRATQHIALTVCPACDMMQRKLFEGEITIRNAPAKDRDGILRLAAAFGNRTLHKDPQDRISGIRHSNGTIRITTTENQLAVRLAKKIAQAFSAGRPVIAYAKEPQEVVRIILSFPRSGKPPARAQ